MLDLNQISNDCSLSELLSDFFQEILIPMKHDFFGQAFSCNFLVEKTSVITTKQNFKTKLSTESKGFVENEMKIAHIMISFMKG